MKIRVIAGTYGGRVIEGSSTARTHPMGERIRGALFNKIADELKGAVILDAFAGSGALGIEALSRSAAHATFIEKDRVAAKIISENLELLKIENAKVIKGPVASVSDAMIEQFDVIFADPPYHDPQFSTVVSLFRLLKPGGLMVLSYPGKGEAPTGLEVVVVDDRKYGNAALAFYRKENAQ